MTFEAFIFTVVLGPAMVYALYQQVIEANEDEEEVELELKTPKRRK